MESTHENQHEFFPDFVRPEERKTEPRGPAAGRTHKPILFTTTIEQILFTSIVAILVLCLVYFLGILRGKSLPGQGNVSVRAVSAISPRPGIAPVRVSAQPVASGVSIPATRPASFAAAPTPARTPLPAAAATGQKRFTIQIVTHKKRVFAESELAAITKAGFSGRVVENDGYYVVSVGQYTSKETAQKDLAFLRAKYPDCFVRRL